MKLKSLDMRQATALDLRTASSEPLQRWGLRRAISSRPWSRIRSRVLIRDRYTCQICGQLCDRNVPGREPEVDHVVPLSQGGTDDDSNLATVCVTCHKVKTQAESLAGKKL